MQKNDVVADPAKFIVRGYQQHPAYARYCAGTLDDLRADPPQSARELVEKTAYYLRAKDGGRLRMQRLDIACKRELLRSQCGDLAQTPYIFGSAFVEDYGVLGNPGFTEIKTADLPDDNDGRNYLQTLQRIYPELNEADGIRNFQKRTFSYPVPGTNRKLELMTIGHPLEIFHKDRLIRDGYYKRGGKEKSKNSLYWRHPDLEDNRKYEDFIRCITPLFETIRDQDAKPYVRQDAALTLYWLVAQATPVRRGGSAHSRIILEYVAPFAEIEVPHMRADHDLWAEAAGNTLEGFKARFRSGAFFDRTVTSDEVLAWQHQMFRELAASVQKEEHALMKDLLQKAFPPEEQAQQLISYLNGLRESLNALAVLVPQEPNNNYHEYADPYVRVSLIFSAARLKSLLNMPQETVRTLFQSINALPPSSEITHYFHAQNVKSYVKTHIVERLLPLWRRQLAAEQDQAPSPELHGMLAEAVMDLQRDLPRMLEYMKSLPEMPGAQAMVNVITSHEQFKAL